MSAPERNRSLTSTVIRGIGFAGSGFVLARSLTLVTYIVLARLVTPEELGQYAAGSIFVALGLLLAGSGMTAALIHRHDRIDEAASTATVATLAAGLVLAPLAWVSAPIVGAFFRSDTVTEVAAAMAGVLFLNSGGVVPNALLQRRFSFLRRLVVEPAAAIAFGVGAIIATSEGLGVWGLVVGLYASTVTDVVLTWGLARWRPRASEVSFAMWRELIGYARHVLAGTIVRRVGDRIPVLAAGRFVGTAALGQLQYGLRIVTTPFSLLVAGISYVIFPAFARIARDQGRFEPAFLRSLRWMALIAMPIGFILVALGEPLAIVVFGETWAEAGEITVALALFIPARSIAALIGEGFKGTGLPPERTRVNIAGVVAGALAMAVFVPLFGVIGVALGISVDALASAVFSLARAHRAMGISIGAMLARIRPPLAASVGMLAVVLPLELLVVHAADHGTAIGLLLLVGEGLLGLAIYVAILHVIAPGVIGELVGLVRTARRSGPAPAAGAVEDAPSAAI